MRTHLNYMYRVTTTPISPIFIFLSKHLLPQMNVMLDFICMDSVELQDHKGSEKIQKEKFFFIVGLQLTTLRFIVSTSTDWASGNHEGSRFKMTFMQKPSVRQIHRTVRPARQICDRSDLPHFQPDRNVRCCFQYYVYYVYSESDRYKFGPMKWFS